jgi:hypothetical protein
MNRQIASVQYVGGTDTDPDYVYYNADIVNNTTDDQTGTGDAVQDPNIVFNETRDYPILKDISKYNFSIVRFTMNGANLDLPLFIPNIREGTGQVNPNLTTYGVAIPYQQTISVGGAVTVTAWSFTTNYADGDYVSYKSAVDEQTYYAQAITASGPAVVGVGFQVPDPAINSSSAAYWVQLGKTAPTGSNVTLTVTPPTRYVIYSPQNKNKVLAPTPLSLANDNFKGAYAGGTTYTAGQIVSTTALNGLVSQNTYDGPFYEALQTTTGNVPNNNSVYWRLVGTKLGKPQDLSTDYYWVYTYQRWMNLVNLTIFNPDDLNLAASGTRLASTCAICDTFYAFYDAWIQNGTLGAFPYATLKDFLNATAQPPQMTYDGPSQRFTIRFDSDGYGARLTPFTPTVSQGGLFTPPQFKLFMNTNMFNLFANFSFLYWNTSSPVNGPYAGIVAPNGYVYEVLVPNKFYTDVQDYRLSPYGGTPPLGFVPSGSGNPASNPLSVLQEQKVYWTITQETASTDTLWSPISSIVFASALMPVKPESNSAPVIIGQGNIGNSQATAKAAFTRVITDLALPMDKGAASWKSFIYYVPSAQYRMSDFLSSHQPLNGVDVQVYWKNRLNNQLYPITMTNLSSVSFKIMFKKKELPDKGDNDFY